jgi:hypothetical protein
MFAIAKIFSHLKFPAHNYNIVLDMLLYKNLEHVTSMWNSEESSKRRFILLPFKSANKKFLSHLSVIILK